MRTSVERASPCTVLVFARVPVAGQAKTRLVPALGATGAARLAWRMLEHAVDVACSAALGPVELCCTPDGGDAALAALARRCGTALRPQGDGDLGARMACAFGRALATVPRALLIGTDAPALASGDLRDAANALVEHDAVYVPATDGGYALVGLRRHLPELFAGIDWSTPAVMAQTRSRLARAGVSHRELGAVSDVDEPADLRHVPAGWLS
jgi:hypothetical protein